MVTKMKLAFLFAGQGSQHPGMGRDLYESNEAFRNAFDSAELDFDLKSVCFDDPDGVLNLTAYTQPCMVAFAAGMTAALYEAGIRPDCSAGLSLGEYSALHAAGVWDAKTAVELTAFRGRAMTKASEGIESAMTAVIAFPEEELKKCCNEASSLGVVQICNYNCPGQLVIGGERAAVERAAALAKEAGAKRCLPLKVSGPFHTKLMSTAGDALEERFREVEFGKMNHPVLFNCLGDTMGDGDTIPSLLVRQVQSSVYMEKTLLRMKELGVDTFVEIGPGRALSGFVKKTLGSDVRCIPIETAAELEEAKTILLD